ncbi:lysine rich nucleolar protein 1 [Rhinolophus ferrumequinum]|uniref:Lysine rich nucleolar protein 1 n=1 Tax=Rhinolophus ferrumequinum TaxID=59479 RepID=A0A7J7R8M8_RHIFE|nr:lysine rich nucleolar protein 1 [Rhinolophus ferrumequinum]
MITKTHEEDLGFGLPEKKKKKKKKKVVVKETETQYSVLNSDNYFSEVCPPRAISPSKSGVQGQVPKMPLVKQKKKKKGHSTVYGEHPDAETAACARQTELPGPRKQPRGPSESLCGEKKNKKSLRPLATSPGSRVKTSPDPRQDEEEPDTDLEVVLEKKGNMDETHIDQVRRKALQEEIDRESGKTEASETRKWTVSLVLELLKAGTQFGQWDTAGFENEEQKLKFLKLMGGFKNLSPALRRPPHTTDRPNMALSKAAADGLQQSLQQDYERAASWKYRRGAGLGFPTAPNKVFYIDRNASRSIKFED